MTLTSMPMSHKNTKKTYCLCLLDLSAVFDTTDHNILLICPSLVVVFYFSKRHNRLSVTERYFIDNCTTLHAIQISEYEFQYSHICLSASKRMRFPHGLPLWHLTYHSSVIQNLSAWCFLPIPSCNENNESYLFICAAWYFSWASCFWDIQKITSSHKLSNCANFATGNHIEETAQQFCSMLTVYCELTVS